MRLQNWQGILIFVGKSTRRSVDVAEKKTQSHLAKTDGHPAWLQTTFLLCLLSTMQASPNRFPNARHNLVQPPGRTQLSCQAAFINLAIER